MRSDAGPITIRRAGAVVESETTVVALGPHVVVLTTAVPAIATQITTTYVGARDVDTTAVDLMLAARPDATSRVRVIPRESVPVTHDRGQCLLDHARQVMIAVHARESGGWTIDVSDQALERAAAV